MEMERADPDRPEFVSPDLVETRYTCWCSYNGAMGPLLKQWTIIDFSACLYSFFDTEGRWHTHLLQNPGVPVGVKSCRKTGPPEPAGKRVRYSEPTIIDVPTTTDRVTTRKRLKP